ncbi:MAG: phosphoribulokinase / Uridine kinase family protein [Herbinix sp.]|jgi:uridine kinase|nr:phosphoribulokinase / Uridine kinase family protein [Herbinix sp.]
MKKPFVVGIAGGSASGKSTLSYELEKKLESYTLKTFHMDEYFKKREDRPYSEAPIVKKMYVDDNHPLTMDLPQLEHDLSKAMEQDYDIIIIEGLLTLWDNAIYEKLDLKLFVDCKSDERIVRRLRRNMTYGLTFDEISGVYLDMVRYRHDEYVEPTKWKADFILNGSIPSSKATEVLIGYITSCCDLADK